MAPAADPQGVSATMGVDAQAAVAASVEVGAAPAIAIVMLTWNGRDDTLACLERLVPQLESEDRLVVVDNGSTDGTAAAVRALYPAIEVIENGANLGFAGGNDVGLRLVLAAGFSWVLLLNNDTLPEPGTLAALRRHAAIASADVAALQPVLVQGRDPTRIDSAGHRLGVLPGVRDLLAGAPVAALPAAPFSVFGACAAAVLVRAEALARVGLLDEALFVLFEDVDLAFRLRAAGFDVQTLPAVRVPHHRGVSARRGVAGRRRRRYWVQRNIVALALRWWPLPALALAAPLLLLRAIHALWLAEPDARTMALWRCAWRERSANRRAMRATGADRWFGASR